MSSPRKISPSSKPPAEIATLAITLDVEPVVQRRIEVPLAIRLDQLHRVFQVAMGWEDDHLWEIRAGRRLRYGMAGADDLWPPRPADRATLATLLKDVRKKPFEYLYDFGDSWLHTVTVEALAAAEPGTDYPRLLSAEGRCPPEDIGGAWGYADFLEDMKDPNSERYQNMVECSVPPFDPTFVDEAAIGERLKSLAELWRDELITPHSAPG